ncbi:MAG: hypothetical protein ABJD68_13185, partial [Nakamurella sp.]
LAGIDRDPTFWWHVYEAISTVDRPPDSEDLADIPIPLIGGRRILGARGCLLTGSELDPALAQRAGQLIESLRIVHPAAAHPLLARLGARPADPDRLLAEPLLFQSVSELRAELEDSDPDPDDIHELAELVLDLVAAGGRAGTEVLQQHVFAGELVLTDVDGHPWPAGELFIPGAPLAAVLTSEFDRPLIGPEWTERYSNEVLIAVGVRYGFSVVMVEDPQTDLPDVDDWWEEFGEEVTLPFPALRDLDLVDERKWPQALELIATDRSASACLVGARDASGGVGLTYSGWWISRFGRIRGRPPAAWRLPGATELAGLYDPLPVALQPHFARSIGVQAGIEELVTNDPAALLDRLADPRRVLPPGRVGELTAAVVNALRGADDLDLPSGVRTVTGVVVDAAEAMVLDLPWLVQVLPVHRLVPGGVDPELVARVLDLPLASSVSNMSLLWGPNPAAGSSAEEPAAAATATPWSAQVQDRLGNAAAAIGVDLSTIDIVVTDALRVSVDGGEPITVTWWGSEPVGPLPARGEDPAGRAAGAQYWLDGSAEACGRVVAWAAGAWPARQRAIAAADNDWQQLAEDSVG